MPRLVITLAMAALIAGAARGQEPPVATPDDGFATPLEKSSYALGFSFGNVLQKRKVEFLSEQVLAGVRDALSGQGGRISEQEADALTRQAHNAARRRLQQERAALAKENMKEGEAFLAANKKRPSVVTTPSGLQYEVLREGDGPKPAPSDTVRVHYRGTLIDGSTFDSSYELGRPAVVRPDRVILAWTEALPMMSVGSKWRLYVPPDLGFEKLGISGPNVPPGATLIYEVELLSLEPSGEAEAAAGSQIKQP
jgi:FKBP-type peptidyl-prolyl cis-trans isomerase